MIHDIMVMYIRLTIEQKTKNIFQVFFDAYNAFKKKQKKTTRDLFLSYRVQRDIGVSDY